MSFMLDDCLDSVKKYVELQINSDEEVYVDDFIAETFEDLAMDTYDVDVLGQYYHIFAVMSSVSSRMRVATEKSLTNRLLDNELQRLEEE